MPLIGISEGRTRRHHRRQSRTKPLRSFAAWSAGAATDARARVEATAASYPSTEIVLGGYSQGAAVIDLITGPEDGSFGFARPLPANVASHVAAVTVFGNPLNRFGRPLTAWSPVYGVKTIDLCTALTPSALAVAMSAHTVSTSNPAWQIRLRNSLWTAYRPLNDPAELARCNG